MFKCFFLSQLNLMILTQSKLVPTTTMPIREHSHLGAKNCHRTVPRGATPPTCHPVTTPLASPPTPDSGNPVGHEKMNAPLRGQFVPG